MYTGAVCFRVQGNYQLQMRIDVMSLTRTSICMGEAKEALEIMGEDWVIHSGMQVWDACVGSSHGKMTLWECAGVFPTPTLL